MRNGRKSPIFGPKNAPFCSKNANLPNRTRFTRHPPPPKMGFIFLGPFFSSCFAVSSASSKRVLKNYFYRVLFEHPSKASSNIMQQQLSKPWTPSQKKNAHVFFGEPLFWPKTTLKNTNFAPLPENCALKNLKKNLVLLAQKGGQVIDLEVAKLLTLKWPKCGQVMWSYSLGQVWPF